MFTRNTFKYMHVKHFIGRINIFRAQIHESELSTLFHLLNDTGYLYNKIWKKCKIA